MKNKIYYGEYSLKHWINLIQKENVILPDYQRHFVWSEDKVRTLIKTMKEGQFVPPVTIGAFNIENKLQNLIIDGQQRLTSILLAFKGLYPDKEKYKKLTATTANENDDEGDDEQIDIIEWTFKTYLDEQKKALDGHYQKLNLQGLDGDFLENTFLGFAYLVPGNISNTNIQQKYYSSVFRNINIQGEPLLPQESRKSLYFLNKDLESFFAPDFCKKLTIKNIGTETKLDFVRNMSFLFQYHKEKKVDNIAKYYGRKMEKYYEEYIYSIVGDNDSGMFSEFYTLFPDGKYASRFGELQQTMKLLEINQFHSIIDSDIYLFGLIYEIVFKGKKIDVKKKGSLKKELDGKIEILKNSEAHKKTPSALKYLRSRIEDSMKIYKKYIE